MKRLLNFAMFLIFALMIMLFILLSSCKTLKGFDCVSKKYIPITYIDNNDKAYTVIVPYCDTVRIKKAIPDTTALMKYKPQSVDSIMR